MSINLVDQNGEIYGISRKELVEIFDTLTELKFFTKDWVFVLNKLDGKWSAVRRAGLK